MVSSVRAKIKQTCLFISDSRVYFRLARHPARGPAFRPCVRRHRVSWAPPSHMFRSHSILTKHGVRICSSCGYFTVTRVRKLKDACQGNLSKARKSDLNNWAIDLPPNGLDRWPVFPPGASR